jgi:hypothetical protein
MSLEGRVLDIACGGIQGDPVYFPPSQQFDQNL